MGVWEIDFGAKKRRFGDFVVKNGDLGAKVPMLGTLKRHILFLEFFRRDLS